MHYAQVLQLDDLAKVAGVSPNHLIRLFKQELQLTPLEWLWRERIRQAETLLEHSGFSVSEIAFRCGFQNPYHFSRRFKETTGTSPKSYRQKRWKYQ
jgi:AraC family transcriptional regulator of arabinose operon